MLHLLCRRYTYPVMTEPALGPLELAVDHGEVVGLMGPNEAGKTTLGLVLSGMAPAVVGGVLDGSLEIDGTDTRGQPAHELAQRVGYVAQNPATQLSHLSRTVYEEVALGPMNLGLSRDEIVERVDDALARLGIEELALRDPRRLSGGQAQLVAIASLLAMRPSHLVLDEPTSQLDPAGSRLVRRALAELVRQGAALVLIEHKADLMDGLCRRIVVLDHGRIVLDDAADAVFGHPDFLRLGLVPPARVRLHRLGASAGVTLDPQRLAAALDDGARS